VSSQGATLTRARLEQDFAGSSTPRPWRTTPGQDQRRPRRPGRSPRDSSRLAAFRNRHGVARL